MATKTKAQPYGIYGDGDVVKVRGLSFDEVSRRIGTHAELVAACEAALANLTPTYASDHFVIKSLRAAIARATA